MMNSESKLIILVLVLLSVASGIGMMLRREPFYSRHTKLVEEIIVRTNAWWLMTAVFLFAILVGFYGVTFLFLLISLLALREYLSLIPTNLSDHRALFWSFAVIAPMQFLLVGINWYGLQSIFIPVYAFLFVPMRMVLTQDTEKFLDRAARIQWGLMLFAYLLSYAPALLLLEIPGFLHRPWVLLFFLVFITEMSDILQFIFGKAFGRRKIAPLVSPNKTWEGLIGGLLGSAFLGMFLSPVTPFSAGVGALFGLLIAMLGFFGGLTMSAIKRDIGVKDYGTLIAGHGGIIDRIDSLTFATPLFFHVIRYYYTV